MVSNKEKQKIVIFKNQSTIEKANYLALSNIERSLTFNQMKLLSFAVLKLPLGELTSNFGISDFADFLGVKKYKKSQFNIDSNQIVGIKFTIADEDFFDDSTNKGNFERAVLIPSVSYKSGTITIKFNEVFETALRKATKRYMTLDLSIMQKMKSGYSWILYEFLKQHYGDRYTKLKTIRLTVNEVYDLFNITPEESTTYSNFGNVKKKIIDVAIQEINEHTELNIESVDYLKDGRSHSKIIFNWTVGKTEYSANDKQIEFLESMIKELSSRKNEIVDSDISQHVNALDIIETLENLDFQGLTKTQASENIDKAKEIINVLNKSNNEHQKQSDTLDLSDEATINEISSLVEKMLLDKGMNNALAEYYGYRYTEEFLPTAKENMQHLDNPESIARYIVTCGENIS